MFCFIISSSSHRKNNNYTSKRKLIDDQYNESVKYTKTSYDNNDTTIKNSEQQHAALVINIDRRHSLTSTEGSGSPRSIYTPLSPEFNDLTTPMIMNATTTTTTTCTKNNNVIHRLPSLRDILFNKSNEDDFNLLPPLSTIIPSNST